MLRRALQAAGILGACVLAATGFACSQGVAEPPGATRIDYGMPARLGRQVAPAPSTPWPSPELREYTRVLKAAEPASLDLQSQPDKHFWGTVVGLGWAVLPENGTSVNG